MVDYKFTDQIFAYASIASGFRSPGVTPRISTIGQLQPITGEEVTSYEMGLKLDLFNRRLRVNPTIFYMDYDPRLFSATAAQCNLASDPNPGTPYFLGGGNCPAGTPLAGTPGSGAVVRVHQRAGEGEGRGARADLGADRSACRSTIRSATTSPRWTWRAVRSRSPRRSATDSSVFVQPKVNMSAGIQYGIPLFGGRLTPRVDAFYQSHRTNGPINAPQLDPQWTIGGYTLLNGRIAYDTAQGDWQVALTATNLTNKFYWYQLGAATTAAGARRMAASAIRASPACGRCR